MASDFVRLPKLRGDVVVAAGDTAPNSTTPAQAQPTGTKLIGFGEQAISSVVNRAIGAVQENVDLLHSRTHGEIAIPQVVDKDAAIVDDGGTFVTTMTGLRVFVNAGANTPAAIAAIISVLDENFNEIEDGGGATCQVQRIYTTVPSIATDDLSDATKRNVHAAAEPITSISKHSVTCADGTFDQAPGAGSLRPVCPGDEAVIANSTANDGTWIVHSVVGATELELRHATDPSKSLDVTVDGDVTVRSNGDFFVAPVLTFNFDPRPFGAAVNVVLGTSRQPLSDAAVPAAAVYPLEVDSLIKLKVQAAEEAAGALPGVHALGGGQHAADTLANLNSKVSDATLDTNTASRPPSGVAGGDLGGTYPNPTVNDGADGTAVHDNVAGEIAAVAAKTPTVGADILLIEDSAAGNAKKKITVADLRVTESQVTDLDHAPTGAAGGDLGGTYPNPTLLVPVDIRGGFRLVDDFVAPHLLDSELGELRWRKVAIGAGGADAGDVSPDSIKECGVKRIWVKDNVPALGDGTVWSLDTAVGTPVNGIIAGALHNDLYVSWKVKPEYILDVKYWFGMLDANNLYPDAGYQGVGFRVDAPGAGVVNWSAFSKVNGEAEDTADTGVVLQKDNFTWLTLLMKTDRVEYYVDGALKGTLNDLDKIPDTSEAALTPVMGVIADAASDRSFLIDTWALDQTGLSR